MVSPQFSLYYIFGLSNLLHGCFLPFDLENDLAMVVFEFIKELNQFLILAFQKADLIPVHLELFTLGAQLFQQILFTCQRQLVTTCFRGDANVFRAIFYHFFWSLHVVHPLLLAEL